MPSIVVDNALKFEVKDGCLIYCGPVPCAPGSSGENDTGQALCWSWQDCPPDLKDAFLKLRHKWAGMIREFMQNNRAALP